MRIVKMVIAAAALQAATAQASVNIIPTNWFSMFWPGNVGVLRAGSPWGPGSTPSSIISVVDGSFATEQQQWNNGSFWWDETVSGAVMELTINLDSTYTFDQLVMQADNNDDYQVEYWTGAAWAPAFRAAAVSGFGLMTRDSGTLPSLITTNRFRLSAVAGSGDQYYSISEFQAFAVAVPEPATWAMMLSGFGIIGASIRRNRAYGKEPLQRLGSAHGGNRSVFVKGRRR